MAEFQRGIGEGSEPWDRPGTTMTNGTLDSSVASVDGQVLTVKYKGGEKKIIVGPDAVILANVAGDRSELKPGAHVYIVRPNKTPDGTLEIERSISVGVDGVVP